MKLKTLATIMFFYSFYNSISAQGGATSCANLQNNFQAYQSCATNVPFANQTSNNSENLRPSCFGLPPKGPTWFFLKIKNAGNIDLQISQISNLGNPTDVDFGLWGPFTSLSNNICSQLNIATEVDCSYFPDAVENVQIPNALAGQYYILLVDNYDQISGTISIQQTGGTGNSDCSFLSSVKIKDISNNDITQYSYCKPATKDLKAVIDVTDFAGNLVDLRFNYRWSRNGIVISTLNNSTLSTNTLSASETGLYKIDIAVYDVSRPGIDINNIPFLQDQTATIDLGFYSVPVLNSTAVSANLCDLTAPNNDGITSVDLNQFYNNITNSTPGISLRYYTDVALTQQISVPTSFRNTIANSQTIYVVGEMAGQPYYCPSNVAQIQLSISPTSLAVYPNIPAVCATLNMNHGFINFDVQRLAIKNTFFLTTNVNIQFYDNIDNASLDLSPLTNASQIAIGTTLVYVKVKSGVNCSNVGTFSVTIKKAPILTAILDVKICRSENLLLITKDSEALLGQPNTIQSSYHSSMDDAKNNSSIINKNIAFAGTIGINNIYVRLYDSATNCFSIVTFAITIYANPILNISPLPYAVCGVGTGIFNLQSRTINLIGNNTYALSFFETIADLTANTPISNTINYVSTAKTIFVKATDNANNNCTSITSLQLVLYANPGSNSNPSPFLVCSNTGFSSFDLTTKEVEMVGTTPIADIVFRYYENPVDAAANSNNIIPIATSFTNTFKNYQKIYVRINNVDPLLFCFSILELELFVGENPVVNFSTLPYNICTSADNIVIQEAVIDTKLIPQIYYFQWFTGVDAVLGNEIVGETNPTFSTSIEGNYSVKITNYSVRTNCVTVANLSAKILTTPTLLKILPDEIIAFADANTISVTATPPSPEYEYQLNFGTWQNSNVFNDLKPGINTVQVRNKRGCEQISKTIIVADFQSFFTPNGDSFNDFWKIDGDAALDITSTFIYDRYGKLLYEHKKTSQGWDGSVSGKAMPADDYWFKIIYNNKGSNGEFKGHFSLKR